VILQQIIGVLNLAVPIVIAYYFFPRFVLSMQGIAFFALLIGSYVAFVHYKQAKNLDQILKYTPTEQHLAAFHKKIEQCGLDPSDVQLRYGYNNDNIATTSLNTLIIDPMVWHGVNDDKDVIAITDVIQRQILPHATQQQKDMHESIKTNLTQEAQDFIFRHELGHIDSSTSIKVIAAFFAIGVTATVVGMSTTAMLIGSYGGWVAVIAGMVTGGITDKVLALVSNSLVKAHEEYKADMFAVKHSSAEEIQAAAHFFSQYEAAAKKINNSVFLYSYLPVSATTAHPDAMTRVAYLEKAVQEKTKTT